MTKKINHSFNHPDTLMVVSSWPFSAKTVKSVEIGRSRSESTGTKQTAIAWHAKRTLTPIAKRRKILVLADLVNVGLSRSKSEKHHSKGNIRVKRVWESGNPLSLMRVAQEIVRNYNTRHVLFQFEFNLFGSKIATLLFPLLLAIARLSGKRVTVEIHEAVTDLSTLSGHIHVKNRFYLRLLNSCLHLFYKVTGLMSHQVIATEGVLKTRLAHYISKEKIAVVPLAVTAKKAIAKNRAKATLNLAPDDFVVMVFGHVTWYKGTDFAVKTMAQSRSRKIRLLVAGGKSPTYNHNTKYTGYYLKTKRIADLSNNITFTGYVPDKKISTYFAAADLVVVPYRTAMSASGSLVQAVSHGKPVLLAVALSEYEKSEDFANARERAGLSHHELYFPLDEAELMKRVQKARINKKYLRQLALFSRYLARSRAEAHTAAAYYSLFLPYEIKNLAFA